MRLETRAVHGAYGPGPGSKVVAVPMYRTASYALDDTQQGADLFALEVQGSRYTRIAHPATAVLEQRLAELEGGVGALVLASGQAAIACSVLTIAEQGDNIIAASSLYGASYNLFAQTLPRLGIEARFADPGNPAGFWPLVDTRTKAVFVEAIGDPRGNVVDLQAFADIAHKAGVPLIVDNTLPTPYLCRPFEFGADIVVHSLTKYLGGHGDSVGGAVVDSGRFPWAEHKTKFRRLNEPDASHRGVVYIEALGNAAFIGRARVVPLHNLSAPIAPLNSCLILQALETLGVRMDRICENAARVARYLAGHANVGWVRYAGLPDHPDHALAERYLGGRACGSLSFGIHGGREAGARFVDALQLVSRPVHIGDARSLATQPASTTHRQRFPSELEQAGVSDDMVHDMVRLSIGIEHIDDLLQDIRRALRVAVPAAAEEFA